MTSENVTEQEAAESAAAVSAKAVDDQLIDEPVSRAQAEDLRLTCEGGMRMGREAVAFTEAQTGDPSGTSG